MSLKLDELRKRLLQQQSGSEGGSPTVSAGNGRIFGAAPPKAAEAVIVPKAFEPSPTTQPPEPSAATYSKLPASEPPALSTASEPADSDGSKADECVSSIRNDPEQKLPAFPVREAVAAVSASAPVPAAQHELADAVGKVFEQTKAFRARLEDLNRIFEPIDRMGNSAVRAFGALGEFHKQMAQLAHSFVPMRTFQQKLSQLAQTCEPMKALEGQISELADSFQSHLGDLINALEPAKQMRDRIEQLSAAFDQATELQEQFTELYDAFRLGQSTNEVHVNGAESLRSAAR
jgi:hypothetical protein